MPGSPVKFIDLNIDFDVTTLSFYYSGTQTPFQSTTIWNEFTTPPHQIINIKTGLLPAPPTNLVQTATTGHPHLQWSHPTEDPEGTFRTGYNIYRRLLPDHDWEVFATVAKNVNSFIDNSYEIVGNMGTHGQPISYRISAINGIGFESDRTDTVQVKRPSINFPEKKKGQSNQVLDNSLSQCYPNPFNPSTNISYNLAEKSFVEIAVYDNLGREIEKLVSDIKDKGIYEVEFNARNLSSGTYFYSIKTDKFRTIRKMLLLK
ncbi:MAG: T9SS type A sorting domain-containing protein [Ignavibacteriaceae bacterium]|nr:T9SS type A sorting domain-containing protein [Ignavibacteriaceae bacterium]